MCLFSVIPTTIYYRFAGDEPHEDSMESTPTGEDFVIATVQGAAVGCIALPLLVVTLPVSVPLAAAGALGCWARR